MFRQKLATLFKKRSTLKTVQHKKKEDTLQHIFKYYPHDIHPSLFRKAEVADYNQGPNIVYIAPSTLCKGKGLFAAQDIPPHTPITGYKGKYMHRNELAHAKDSFLFQFHDETYYMDGARDPNRPWLQEGLAQYANDAIHVSLTGKENNATFEEVVLQNGEKKCFLVSKDQVIRKDEEICVSYTLSYWIDLLRHHSCDTFTPELVHWIRCHIFTENILKKRYPMANIYLDDYHDFHLIKDDESESKGYACYVAQIENYPFSSYCLECPCKKKHRHIHAHMEKIPKTDSYVHVTFQCGTCDTIWFNTLESLEDSIYPENEDIT